MNIQTKGTLNKYYLSLIIFYNFLAFYEWSYYCCVCKRANGPKKR
jgi:hypothetical protein